MQSAPRPPAWDTARWGQLPGIWTQRKPDLKPAPALSAPRVTLGRSLNTPGLQSHRTVGSLQPSAHDN